jgi:hypothetical protein
VLVSVQVVGRMPPGWAPALELDGWGLEWEPVRGQAWNATCFAGAATGRG